MARFYDRLMHNNSGILGDVDAVIVADNVAQYLHEQNPKILGADNWKDYPSIMMPFNRMFIEFRNPFRNKLHPQTNVGCYIEVAPEVDELYVSEYAHAFGFPDPELVINKFELNDTRQIVLLDLYCSYRKKWTGAEFATLMRVDINGNFIKGFWPNVIHNDSTFRWNIENLISTHPEISGELDDPVLSLLTVYGYPFVSIAMMAIALMNAKNTKLIDNPPPAKLSKRHEKKYGVPLVTYKTLKVNPIGKVNANDYDDNNSGGDSIPKSLHIARGHFKDFRKGKGLFGIHQDIFWWDAHVRGNAKAGVTIKDYDVQAPEGDDDDQPSD